MKRHGVDATQVEAPPIGAEKHVVEEKVETGDKREGGRDEHATRAVLWTKHENKKIKISAHRALYQ